MGSVELTSEVAPQQQDDELDLLCRSLSEQLGSFGYQWLCACAVFPVLQLALTVHLGDELARAAGRQRPSEQELLTICRLPWFRKGWMPDELRLRLANNIAEPFRNIVREAISRFVFSAINDPSRSNDRAPLLQLVVPPDSWNAALDSWIAVGSEDTGPDVILLSFMRQSPLAPPLLREGTDELSMQSAPRDFLEPRTLAVFLSAVGLSAFFFLYSGQIASVLLPKPVATPTNTPTPTPTPTATPTPTSTPTPTPTPTSLTVTYRVCTGEIKENCPPHDVFLGCFTSVESWARTNCTSYTPVRLDTHAGNKCGYSLTLVTCFDPIRQRLK